MYYEQNYISMVDETSQNHRSKIIIHRNMWYLAEFQTIEQLNYYSELMGFSYKLREQRENSFAEGMYYEYDISHRFDDTNGGQFWKRSDVPENAIPFKALSNGSIVTCYFVNDGETIHIYRPNPNAKEVYKPLSTDLHIAHQKIYGTF